MMATRIVRILGVVLVPLLVLVGGLAVAAEDLNEGLAASGASRAAREAPPIIPNTLDDTLRPVTVEALATSARDISDTTTELPSAAPPRTLAERLEAIDVSRRETVTIDVELAGRVGESAAVAVESFWDAGDFEAALEALRALESEGRVAGVGIDWGIGAAAPKDWTTDSRVGGTREEAQDLRLDFHAASANQFSVIRWGSTTGTSAWTLNLSTDYGDTWVETYSFGSANGLVSVAAAVVDDYVYIAYVAGNATGEARLRRASALTGAIDGGFGFVVVTDGGAVNVDEVALAANADDFDNRIYYLTLMADGTIRYLWDQASDGQTFTDGGFPATAQASFSLDATFINNGDCVDFLAISYAASDGTIRVWRRDETTWTESVVQGDAAGSYRRTSIGAYGTTLLCAFEFPYADGTGIRYAVSYNCGANWSAGDLAVPDGAFYFGFFEPEVAARGGYGTGVAYQGEGGDFDPAFYRFRYGYNPGTWTTPARFNDHDLYTGSDMEIMIMPPMVYGSPPEDFGTWSVAALYLSLDDGFRVPYFDLTVDLALFDGPPLFADSFESADVGAWDGSVP